jgi:hypothetical protein
MEIKEIISYFLNTDSNILEVSFRTIDDDDDVLRNDQIDYTLAEEYGYELETESVKEAAYGYKDSTASYIDKHKEEFKAAEKMNKGNEQSFYDSLSTLEEKLGHPKYMIFLSNALRGYKVDMYKDPKIKNQQEAEEALFLLSK